MRSNESDTDTDLDAIAQRIPKPTADVLLWVWTNFVVDWKLCAFTDSEYESCEEMFVKEQWEIWGLERKFTFSQVHLLSTRCRYSMKIQAFLLLILALDQSRWHTCVKEKKSCEICTEISHLIRTRLSGRTPCSMPRKSSLNISIHLLTDTPRALTTVFPRK